MTRRWPPHVYGVGSEPDVRFSLANERTFLAWIRTALGFLAGGVAITALGQFSGRLGIELRIAALLLVLAGLVCGVGGFLRWAQLERAIRLGRPLPAAPAMVVVTVLLVLVTLTAAVLVVTA